MLDVLATFALLAMAAFCVTVLGGALTTCSSRGRALVGLPLLCYAVAFGILAMALIGAATVSLSQDYRLNARSSLGVATLVALWRWHRHRILPRMFECPGNETALAARWVGVAWVGLAAIGLAVSYLPVKLPPHLPDGAYVIKSDRLHVRVQRLLGDFPADNYIPFVATEYLLRDIPFAEERPLMPGQELANRPILLSLAAIPLRAAFDPPPRFQGILPLYSYVGQQWPDNRSFGEDVHYRDFLAISLLLNASLVLGLALAMRQAGLNRWYCLAGIALFVTSPYFFGQTLFAWPKSLAGFFLLLAAYTLLARRRTWVAGALVALAYWSHPFALAFALGFGLYLMVRERDDPDLARGLLPFAVVAGIGIAAWMAWSGLYLRISSDLVAQNNVAGSWSSLLQTRLVNAWNSLLPLGSDRLLVPSAWPVGLTVGIIGGIGLLLLPAAVAGAARSLTRHALPFTTLALLPGCMLIAVFGVPNVPGLHGLQPLASVLLVMALRWMQDQRWQRLWLASIGLQLLLNLAVLAWRGLVTTYL